MSKEHAWSIPAAQRPRQQDLGFDLQSRLRSMVLLHADIPDDAYTASMLGSERLGYGVVIRHEGRPLVLTVGYLITEAQSIWLTTHSGNVTEGCPLAFDQTSGFGLVMPLGPMDATAMEPSTAAGLEVGDALTVIGHGTVAHSIRVRLVARREFAGYWEYLLDDALFTAPVHPQWGGTALLDADGRLAGIGSLFVQEMVDGRRQDMNLFVPIDLLLPVLADLVRIGRPARAPRPWLGLYTTTRDEHIVVAGLTRDGPAHRAGIRLGDVITGIAGQQVLGLAELFRGIWRLGEAGVDVPLTLARGSESLQVQVHSACRDDFLRKPQQH